jgi:iron complex transport system substrate-binding protein
MPPTRRSFLTYLSALAAAPVLAACGDSDTSTSSASGRATVGGSEDGALPVSIAHKFGTTTVTEVPERVVCVGLVEQDALLALGIVPVATTKWFGKAPGCIFPWATDKLGGATLPTVLDATNGILVEKVAAQGPDLIIGLYSGMTRKEYDLLSKIAPTVAQPKAYVDYGTPWDESTLTIGKAVGRPAAAEELVDTVTARIEKEAGRHPEFAGKKAAVVTPYEGLFVYGPEDPRGRLLEQLGFEFPQPLLREKGDEFGWSVSAERTTDLDDLDVVVWLDLADADQALGGLWQRTRAYREGRFFDISDASGAYYVGHSMVTPLSIPYVLDRYVPQLAAAVDGDPRTKPPTVRS